MRFDDRHQMLGWIAAGLAIVLLGAWWVRGAGSSDDGGGGGVASARAASAETSEPAAGSGDDGVSVSGGAAADGPVVIDVAGWVRHPGVFRLPGGSRVQDAVRRAGGAKPGADLAVLNLAAKLTDGRQVLVARRSRAVPGGGASSGDAGAGATSDGTAAPAAPVSLNSATADELSTLDGVGPATAQKILDYRTQHGGFGSVDELDQVPGIGPKKLAALRDHVTT